MDKSRLKKLIGPLILEQLFAVSVISMWLGRVIICYILVMHFNMGILGVWIGMFVDWYIRGAGYLIRFKSKKWLDKKAV